MKKILLMMIFSFVISISVANANYYENDQNYKFIMYDGVNGTEVYLNLRSIGVQEYNPPHYQISGQFVFVDDQNGKTGKIYIALRYNYYEKEVFRYNERSRTWYSAYKEGRDNRYSSASTSTIKFSNALFRAAYGMNFYNWGENLCQQKK